MQKLCRPCTGNPKFDWMDPPRIPFVPQQEYNRRTSSKRIFRLNYLVGQSPLWWEVTGKGLRQERKLGQPRHKEKAEYESQTLTSTFAPCVVICSSGISAVITEPEPAIIQFKNTRKSGFACITLLSYALSITSILEVVSQCNESNSSRMIVVQHFFLKCSVPFAHH